MKRLMLTGLGILVTISILSFSSCGTKEAKETKRTLKIWHYESDNGAMGLAWKVAMDKFKEKHPEVTIVYENKGFEQIRQTASMVLNSDDAPDIMEYNKGNASAGLLSKQGLLADLTDEANKRGWDKILSPSLQTTCKYDEKGIMGGDKWYGVTNYGEYVMGTSKNYHF
jgi:raffinose/stachyose/melibiose transport system substrate-binding protein